MDKHSAYLLQKIDCNCNDCAHMERDFETYKYWLDQHNIELKKRYDPSKNGGRAFQADSKINQGFGFCKKLNKKVDFIPSICQIHTQQCFLHRLDTLDEETRNKRLGI